MSDNVKAIMIQGTGSDAGKSIIAAGLARALANRGFRVCPFKPQNMSNNAAAVKCDAVTTGYGEIGRAQALQAMAARRPAHTDMNPVLIKPESECGAQVIIQGQAIGHYQARDWLTARQQFWPAIEQSYARLAAMADIMIVEGAGSPAEINLRARDIANMGFARRLDIPVVLVGDIDRGGVIASLIGTHAVLDEDDRQQIKAFVINKFRGDPALFTPALATIEQRTGWHALGVLPWFEAARQLPAEDAQSLTQSLAQSLIAVPDRHHAADQIKIAVPRLSRIANFDDLDPLRLDPRVQLTLTEAGAALPGGQALIVIPGTKSTRADLQFMRAQGWDIDIAAHIRQGGRVLGLCGGYQILGREISDPDGLEGVPSSTPGLGHLNITTTLSGPKQVRPVSGCDRRTGLAISGYEIHLGRTRGPDCQRPLFDLARPAGAQTIDGAISTSGRVMGSYVHGLFSSDHFRHAFLNGLASGDNNTSQPGLLSDQPGYHDRIEQTLEALADHIEQHIDLDQLLAIMRIM